ncbi:uncharacterized protein LOC130891903 [Diorhabda carinulata]|uniref:uncharacterized protein LOC130891903 n=1 Tax=Diorhabda carinulata TaxID=1163345 RepID=UPI0025A02635|nr:uncharacterized protein LOC130891903 [Diorhabda carinulata]
MSLVKKLVQDEPRSVRGVGHVSKCKIIQKTKQELLQQQKHLEPKDLIDVCTNIKEEKENCKESIEPCFDNNRHKTNNCDKFRPPKPPGDGSTNKSSILELPPLGAKHAKILAHFMPSIGCFVLAGTLCGIYICEWKDVLQYLPYYNGKYEIETTNKNKMK